MSEDLAPTVDLASVEAATPESAAVSPLPADWESVKEDVLAALTQDVERFVRDAHDNIYERLLYTVQYYLSDNAAYNISSKLSSAAAQVHRLNKENDRYVATNLNLASANAALLAAVQNLLTWRDGNTNVAPGHNGDEPWEWARAALAKATNGARSRHGKPESTPNGPSQKDATQ
jgi:hypothetical protein